MADQRPVIVQSVIDWLVNAHDKFGIEEANPNISREVIFTCHFRESWRTKDANIRDVIEKCGFIIGEDYSSPVTDSQGNGLYYGWDYSCHKKMLITVKSVVSEWKKLNAELDEFGGYCEHFGDLWQENAWPESYGDDIWEPTKSVFG